jgi:hypothetical protein
MDDYYQKLRSATVQNAWDHWDRLYADNIRPKKLLENFRTVYRAYSPHKEEEAFVVCPWIPGLRHISHTRSQVREEEMVLNVASTHKLGNCGIIRNTAQEGTDSKENALC